MTNTLYPLFHEKNLSEFNRLLSEAEEFEDDKESKEDKDPGQIQEDEVFAKVKQANEQDVDTNAYYFLDRESDGSFGAMNDITNQKDPAIKGLCSVITGDILQNSDGVVGYITSLFDNTGANDISQEDFKNIKSSIWDKLEELNSIEPVIAYNTFHKFIISLVNGIRDNSGAS